MDSDRNNDENIGQIRANQAQTGFKRLQGGILSASGQQSKADMVDGMLIDMFTGAFTGQAALNNNDFVTRVAGDGMMLDQNKDLPEPLSATKLSPDVFASLEQVMQPYG